MLNLRIQVAKGRIAGSGTDMIGPFTFSGGFGEAGQVVMFKQYIGRHGVDYLGSYDGEGTMWGHWRIASPTGVADHVPGG